MTLRQEYIVKVKKLVGAADIAQIKRGVQIEGVHVTPKEVVPCESQYPFNAITSSLPVSSSSSSSSSPLFTKIKSNPVLPFDLPRNGQWRYLRIKVVEGRKHEVRRLIEAADNEVWDLQRVKIGNFVLPKDLRYL